MTTRPETAPFVALSTTLTSAVARLARERGITVDDLAARASLPMGSLSPVNALTFTVDDIEAVCLAAGVEDAAELFRP